MLVVRDDGVEVTHEQDPPRAGALDAQHEVAAWPGDEQGTRSTVASSGASAAAIDAASSAPERSPDGVDTATSASSSRSRAPRSGLPSLR